MHFRSQEPRAGLESRENLRTRRERMVEALKILAHLECCVLNANRGAPCDNISIKHLKKYHFAGLMLHR